MKRLIPLFLALAMAGPALAAGDVKVTADNFTILEGEGRAVFTGNVVVVHPDVTVWADKVVVFYGEGGSTNIKSFEATERVRLKTPDQDATGTRALFDPKTQILRLTGNVVVTNSGGTLTGPELVVDLNKNTSVFTGGEGGRVTGVFTPG